MCQAVGGALAVLDGEDDILAATEVVFGCVGSGGRAWIGGVFHDGKHKQLEDLDDDCMDPDLRKCQVLRAIDKDFGLIEDESCRSRYPILCRFW